jgi:hypothetical protein
MSRKATSVLVGLIMSQAFLSLLSPSKSAKLMVARAFTTNSHSSLLRSTRTCQLPGAPAFATTFTPASRLYSSRVAADVEEDLDAALDNILGDAMQEAEEPLGSRVVPAKPIEEVSYVMAVNVSCHVSVG